MRRHARRQLNDLNHVRHTQDFQYEPLPTRLRGAEQAHHPVAKLVHPLRHVDGRHSRGARTVRGRVLVAWALRVSCQRRLRCLGPPRLNWDFYFSAKSWSIRRRKTSTGWAPRTGVPSTLSPGFVLATTNPGVPWTPAAKPSSRPFWTRPACLPDVKQVSNVAPSSPSVRACSLSCGGVRPF